MPLRPEDQPDDWYTHDRPTRYPEPRGAWVELLALFVAALAVLGLPLWLGWLVASWVGGDR